MLKAGTWYVVAGRRRPDPHVSRLAGRRGRADEERFDRPEGFDLARYWAEASEAYERDVARIEVTVRVRPDRLDILRDAVGNATVEAAEYLSDPDPEGWLRLRVRLDWPDEAPLTLLRAGPWLEVLDPPDVRTRLAAAARAIADRYAGDQV